MSIFQNKENPGAKKGKLVLRLRLRLTMKTIYIASASAMILIAAGMTIFFNLSHPKNGYALPSTGDYQSFQTGAWSSTSTWSRWNGGAWINPAPSTPTSGDGVITILTTHTVTISSANVTVDQVVINGGGQVTLNSGRTMTINNGSGTDFDVSGTFKSAGTVTQGTSTMIFRNGGLYQHNYTSSAGTIPTATWSIGSICSVIGYTSNNNTPGGLSQSFYDFLWNCPSQSDDVDLDGDLTTITNDFTVANTNNGSVWLTDNDVYTLTIGGDIVIGNGTSTAVLDAEVGSTNCTINIAGNFTIGTNGTFERSGYWVAPVVVFNKASGTQTFNSINPSGINNGIVRFDWRVGTGSTSNTLQLLSNFTMANNSLNPNGLTVYSGSILDVQTYVVGGPTADFSLNSGGGIITAHTGGLASSGATGSVQVTGSRFYSPSADYTFNGSAAQITGNGVPSTVRKLTFNNGAGVTLTLNTTVSSTLTFTNGIVTASNDTLTLGTGTGTLGTLVRTAGHVNGYFKRWIAAAATSNILFPIGSATNYEGMVYSYTTAPTSGGTITSQYTFVSPGNSGLPLNDASDNLTNMGQSLWKANNYNGLTGGAYSLDITATALPGVLDYTVLHIVRRVNAASPWTLNGTHSAGTGTNAIPIAHRTLMTLYGQYGISSSSANPLPIELIYFNAALNGYRVNLDWATATETNNDYFTIERSTDGVNFDFLLRQPGAGNSTHELHYSAVDENHYTGYTYYRLKQTDYDGKFTYSKIISVKNKTGDDSESDLKSAYASPNPFSEKFNCLFILNNESKISLQLMNSAGKIVFKDEISGIEGVNQYQFTDAKKLSAGIYYLTLTCHDKKITQKILKR